MLPYLIRRAIKQWWLVAPRMVLKWSWNARFWRKAAVRICADAWSKAHRCAEDDSAKPKAAEFMPYGVKLPVETKGQSRCFVPLDRLLLKKSPGFLGAISDTLGEISSVPAAPSSECCSPRVCSAKDLRERPLRRNVDVFIVRDGSSGYYLQEVARVMITARGCWTAASDHATQRSESLTEAVILHGNYIGSSGCRQSESRDLCTVQGPEPFPSGFSRCPFPKYLSVCLNPRHTCPGRQPRRAPGSWSLLCQ